MGCQILLKEVLSKAYNSYLWAQRQRSRLISGSQHKRNSIYLTEIRRKQSNEEYDLQLPSAGVELNSYSLEMGNF